MIIESEKDEKSSAATEIVTEAAMMLMAPVLYSWRSKYLLNLVCMVDFVIK
jgi:hypothetical protein